MRPRKALKEEAMKLPTLTGEVDTSELGITLMHEHLMVLSDGVPEAFPHAYDLDAIVEDVVRQVRQVIRHGVRTMVDLSVLGLGRRISLMQRIAAQVPEVNFIVATGLYTYNELPHYFQNRDIDHMAEMFVRDIRQGIQGTGVRAAVLKCATDEPGLTPGVEKVLRAVARAHLKTGVPIYTHTHAGTRRGLEQQRIFQEEGVDLSRVVIGHSGDSEDLGYLIALIENGSYVGMDRFGLYHHEAMPIFPTFEGRVRTVAELCKRGYAERIILSHDCCGFIDWFPMEVVRQLAPRWSYTHIFEDVIPALREQGVTEAQVQQMLVENPRRFFEGR
jgi:phosphotriesterase-related protein